MRPFRLASRLVSLAALLAASRDAAAQCRVAPGPEGELATWLTLASVPTPQTRPARSVLAQLSLPLRGVDPAALAPAQGARAGGLSWRARASANPRLALDAPPRGAPARTVFAGLELRAREATTALLALGTDDGARVWLDGREVFVRGAVRDARDDDDLVALPLAPGPHRLVVQVYVNGGPARLYARLLDERFVPPARVEAHLPGVDEAGCRALGREAASGSLRREVRDGDRVRLRASVRFEGGTAFWGDGARRSATLRAGALEARAEGSLVDAGVARAPSLELTLDAPDALATTAALRLDDERELARAALPVPAPVRVALRAAARALDGLDERALPSFLPRASVTSARYVAQRLAGLVAEGDRDLEHLLDEARTLDELARTIAAGRDPYDGRRGLLRRAYRSEVDDTLQPYSIYVPPAYRNGPTPTVLALHGLGGTAHRMLPVLFGLYDEHEDRTHADRHPPALPDVNALVVAPYGRGDAGYRSIGEVDVRRVLDEVRGAYRTDATRTYITGLSMGGIGAAHVPLRAPGVFAAAAPLCGYHSYFVRGDTRGPRRPWELALMEQRSNASWAENGQHLPLYVVHGTRDQPIANSRVLVERYEQLGYRVEAEWPDLGHNVWSTTYAGGRLFPLLARHRLDESPRRLRLRSIDPRVDRNAWLALDALEAPGAAWTELVAEAAGEALRVETTGALGFTVQPPPTVFAAGARFFALRVDGQELGPQPVGATVSLARTAGETRWRVVSSPARAPLRGSLRDVFDRPVTVVYGASDPAERAMNERVARALARVRGGVRAAIPVVADDALTDAQLRERSLVLVGTPRSNRVLRALAPLLPVQFGDAYVALGRARFEGAGVGVAFTAAHPHRADRMLAVYSGVDARGVWRARALPELVPDFVVYDHRVAPARGRILLGRFARVLAAGFWRHDGSPPERFEDPLAGEVDAAQQGGAERDGERGGDDS